MRKDEGKREEERKGEGGKERGRERGREGEEERVRRVRECIYYPTNVLNSLDAPYRSHTRSHCARDRAQPLQDPAVEGKRAKSKERGHPGGAGPRT